MSQRTLKKSKVFHQTLPNEDEFHQDSQEQTCSSQQSSSQSSTAPSPEHKSSMLFEQSPSQLEAQPTVFVDGEDKIHARFESKAEEPSAAILSKKNRYFHWLAPTFSIIVVIEAITWLLTLWSENPLLSIFYGLFLGGLLLLAGKIIIAEFMQLSHLKRLDQWQQAGERIIMAEQIGEAQGICQQISDRLPVKNQIKVMNFQLALTNDFNDQEIIQLYNKMVLEPIDEEAMQCIYRYASQTSLMVSISPMALMDMLLMLWRYIAMIEQLCDLYGVQLGFYTRLKLIKTVFKHLAFVGTTELLADISATAISLELAARLSSRAAQGLAAGALTVRLGLQVIRVCRPLPAASSQQANLADLTTRLFAEISQALTTKQS